jgi:hypothetical protein
MNEGVIVEENLSEEIFFKPSERPNSKFLEKSALAPIFF